MISSAQAAEIKLVSIEQSDMGQRLSLTLSGPIEKGDAAKLKQLLDGISGDISVTTLTMDSKGGSFAEGVLLARLFTERLVSTLVKRDQHCLSACAIAFMGGATQGIEGGDFRSRGVEIGGHLGFHAPYLNVEAKQYNEKTVEYAYDKAVGSIADMIRLADQVGFSTDILPEILEKGPGDLKELVTVDDFARFEVDILPAPKLSTLTRSMVQNACLNGYIWSATKKPGALREYLIASAEPQMNIYTHMSKWFSYEEEKVTRVVIETAEAGEGTINWCMFDLVRQADGKVRTSCHGFVNAGTLEEAIERSRQFDKGDTGGNPDSNCLLPVGQLFMDESQESGNAELFGMVPGKTPVSEVQAVIDRYLREEKPLLK